jgi:DNA-binding CsgD family transcriptional regulator
MPYDQYEKTEFYQQFLKRYDIYYRVTIPLNIDKDYSGALELYRSKEEGSFSNDMEMIDQLKNYIEIGLCNMRDILNLRDDVQKYRIYFDQIQIGTAIVDDQYQLVKCNKIFRDLLLSYDHDVNFKIFFINNLLNKIKDNYLLGSRITDIWVNGILFRVSLQGTSNYFSPNQYHIVAIRTKDEAERGELSELLSNREIEIVNCISKGYKNDQIAKELFLSVHTVKTHIQNMFKKFNVSNRISLLNRIRDIK